MYNSLLQSMKENEDGHFHFEKGCQDRQVPNYFTSQACLQTFWSTSVFTKDTLSAEWMVSLHWNTMKLNLYLALLKNLPSERENLTSITEFWFHFLFSFHLESFLYEIELTFHFPAKAYIFQPQMSQAHNSIWSRDSQLLNVPNHLL